MDQKYTKRKAAFRLAPVPCVGCNPPLPSKFTHESIQIHRHFIINKFMGHLNMEYIWIYEPFLEYFWSSKALVKQHIGQYNLTILECGHRRESEMSCRMSTVVSLWNKRMNKKSSVRYLNNTISSTVYSTPLVRHRQQHTVCGMCAQSHIKMSYCC